MAERQEKHETSPSIGAVPGGTRSAGRPQQLGWLAWVVTLAALVLVGGFAYMAHRGDLSVAADRFETRVNGLESTLRHRLGSLQARLASVHGHAHRPDDEVDEWQHAMAMLQPSDDDRLVQGVVLVQATPGEAALRLSHAAGPRRDAFASLATGPESVIARLAANSARSAQPQRSPVLAFGQDDDRGMVVVQPLYLITGAEEADRPDKQEPLAWVAALVDLRALIDVVLSEDRDRFALAIEETAEAGASAAGRSSVLTGGPLPADARFQAVRVASSFDRPWILHFASLPKLEMDLITGNTGVFLIFGGLASLLLGALVHLQISKRNRAETLALQLTEESRANETRARAAEERLLDAINSIPDGFAIWDAEDRLVLSNQRYRDMLEPLLPVLVPGTPFRDVVAFSISQRLYPEARGQERWWAGKRLEDHQNPGIVHERRLLNGRWHRVSEQSTAEGGIVTLRTDITDQKETELELRKLSGTVAASPVMVLISDSDGKIEYVNPQFTEITGYQPEEVVGQASNVLKSGQMAQDVYEELWETIGSGRIWRGELLNRKKSGEVFWANASIAPIVDEKQRVRHYVAVHEDITDRKKAEKALFDRLESERILAQI
ncbi:MAG: PAS domain S-box protein, partial [Rhodospirillales bacterium]